MSKFELIVNILLYCLTLICFWLPYKNGKKKTGIITGTILGVLITLTIIAKIDFLVLFIWPFIFAFQIIFITYWIAYLFGKKKLGLILASSLIVSVILIFLSPWINDWTFSKKDAKKILLKHSIEIQDNFSIVDNESGGFRDFYHVFTLELSQSDFDKIKSQFKSLNCYSGFIFDNKNIYPTLYSVNSDSICYETNEFLHFEYISNEPLDDGTFHFRIILNKKTKTLEYIGSDE